MSDEYRNFDRLFKMYEAMTAERNLMRKALLAIAEENNLSPSTACQTARDALAAVGSPTGERT